MRRAPVMALLLVVAGASGAVGACSDFGDEPATPPPDAGAPETASADTGLDAIADAGPDSGACVPGIPFATPDGGVPTTGVCDGTSGVDLLLSDAHCGRCNRACGTGSRCNGGECSLVVERPFVADATISEGAHVMGRVGDDLYFHEGYYRLLVRRPTGTMAVIEDFFGDAADFSLIFGSVGGAPGSTYVRTRARLFRVDPGALVSIGALPDNDHPDQVGVVPGAVYTSRQSRIQRFDTATSAVTEIEAPSSHWVAAHGSAAYWLEMPWNTVFQGTSPASGSTVRRADSGNVFTVHQSSAKLIELHAFSDALHFMQIGTGGGIFRLPFDAVPTTVPERVASDDGLGGRFSGLAEDANDVYWIRPSTTEDPTVYGELWKRAKCGGAAVKLASRLLLPDGLAIVGARVYVGTNDGLVSVAR